MAFGLDIPPCPKCGERFGADFIQDGACGFCNLESAINKCLCRWDKDSPVLKRRASKLSMLIKKKDKEK